MTALEQFNAASDPDATTALLACCGSARWAEMLAAQRPFRATESLLEQARAVWFSLSEPDWLEAFAQHPRIGKARAATTSYLKHSEQEQSAAQGSLPPVAEALLDGNRVYEERFGFRYIVFASGRTAPELLSRLESRLRHTRQQELHEAAEQQMQISDLRLRRWLSR